MTRYTLLLTALLLAGCGAQPVAVPRANAPAVEAPLYVMGETRLEAVKRHATKAVADVEKLEKPEGKLDGIVYMTRVGFTVETALAKIRRIADSGDDMDRVKAVLAKIAGSLGAEKQASQLAALRELAAL